MSAVIYELDVGESDVFNFDYQYFPSLAAGDNTITSATITGAGSGLTVGSPVIGTGDDSLKVQIRCTGVTAETLHTLKCVAETSDGDTLIQRGKISVT